MIEVPNAIHICDLCGELATGASCESCAQIRAAAAATAAVLGRLPKGRVVLGALPGDAAQTNILFREALIAALRRNGTAYFDEGAVRARDVKPKALRCAPVAWWRDVVSGLFWLGAAVLFVAGIVWLFGGGR